MRAATMLLWSQWKQTGWFALAGVVFSALFVWLIHVTPPDPEYDGMMLMYMFLARMTALLSLSVVVLWSLFMHMNRDRLGFGFSRHLSILPMRTGSMVALQIGYSLALVLAMIVAFRWMFFSIPESKNLDFNVLDGAVFRVSTWSVIVAVGYGMVWSFGWLKSWAAALPFAVLMALLVVSSAFPDSYTYLGGAGMAAAVAGAYLARTGRAFPARVPPLSGAATMADAPKRFASADAAQCWFETRSRGWWLFAAHGACMVAVPLLVLFDAPDALEAAADILSRPKDIYLLLVGWVIVPFPWAMLICSVFILAREIMMHRTKEGFWMFTRPMGTADLASARIRANARQFMYHYLAMAVLALPLLPEAAREISGEFQQAGFTSVFLTTTSGAGSLIVAVAVAGGVFIWSLPFHVATFGLGVFVLLAPQTIAMFLIARGPDMRFNETHKDLIEGLTIGSAVFLWAAVLLLIGLAFYRHFLSWKHALFIVVSFGTSLCLIALLSYVDSEFRLEGTMWLIGGLIALAPGLAIALVPLNIQWQRHR
ncbi:MAG: hypothetical protein AMXMBFR84_39270 [Candidatus Hydrogenedentota bacterium]